ESAADETSLVGPSLGIGLELQLVTPLAAERVVYRESESRRRRPCAWRITKDVHTGQAGLARHGLGVRKVLVGLPREADDDVGGDGDIRRAPAEGGDHLEVIAAAIEAPHALQHAVASRLEGDMQVATKAGRARQLGKVRRDVISVDRTEAKPRGR